MIHREYTVAEISTWMLEAIDLARYSVVAVYTLCVYDWLISLEEEYELIHKAPHRWTAVKGAYLVCRYYPIIVFPFQLWAWLGDHTYGVCSNALTPLYVTLLPLQLSAQVVLALRAHAFAGRRTSILIILSLGLAGLLALELYVFLADVALVYGIYDWLGKTGCYGTSNNLVDLGPDAFVSSGAISMAFVFFAAFLYDLLTMSIIVSYCIRHRTAQGGLGRAFLTQGIVVFIAMSALNLLSFAMYFSADRRRNGVGSYFAWIVPDVLACRLVLMLRRRVSPTEREKLAAYSILVREALEMDTVSADARLNLAHPVHELGQGHSHPPQPLEVPLGSDAESSPYVSHRRSQIPKLSELDTGQGFDVEMGEAG